MAFLTLVPPATEPVSIAQLNSYGHIDSSENDSFLQMLITAAREWCEAYCERAFVFQTKRLLMDFFPGYVDFKLAGQRVSSPFVSGSNAVLVGIRYAIALPWPLVRQIVLFQYQDENGATQVMAAGTDFIQDLDSQPARLTPLFGEMWPVARVVANAVQVDFITGYTGNIVVGMTNGSAVLASSIPFLQRDVGAAITVPGAGAAGAPLVTTVASVSSSGVATLAAAASTTVASQTTTFGVLPMSIQLAILALAQYWYEKRMPDGSDVPMGVKALLYPYRDLRL
jgi:hypothetical protein